VFLTTATRPPPRREQPGRDLGAQALHFNRASGAAERGQALAVTPFCFASCVAMKSISPGDKQS
jgi:hypothetical protein